MTFRTTPRPPPRRSAVPRFSFALALLLALGLAAVPAAATVYTSRNGKETVVISDVLPASPVGKVVGGGGGGNTWYPLRSGSCAEAVHKKKKCRVAAASMGWTFREEAVSNPNLPGGCFVEDGEAFFNGVGRPGTRCDETHRCVCRSPYGVESKACDRPLSEPACSEAAAALGVVWGGAIRTRGKPGGCFVDVGGGELVYNGKGREGRKCKNDAPCLCSSTPTDLLDVVIVGAGAAGLAAARYFLDRGIVPTVLEATSRTGGRVSTGELGGTRIELGAEEHYEEGVPFETLRAYFDGPDFSTEGFGPGSARFAIDDDDAANSTCLVDPDPDRTYPMPDCQDDLDFTQYFRIWDAYWTHNWIYTPINVTVEEKIGTMRLAGYPDPTKRGWHLYNNHFAGNSATTVDRMGVAAQAGPAYWWPIGDIRVVTDPAVGYEDGLRTIWWEDTLADVDLRLDSPVTAIENRDDEYVAVTDGNGGVHKARAVVVTASIGVLQADTIEFTPPLPPASAKAIHDIGFDDVMKIFMLFDEDWWTEAAGGPVNTMVTTGLSGWCWPSYKTGGAPIITCYSAGQNYRDLWAKAGAGNETAVFEECLADLGAMFPNAATTPLAAFSGEGQISDWSNAEYTRGGYSFGTTDTLYKTPENSYETVWGHNARVALHAPVAGGRVFFAGEGTAILMKATVPGAVEDGERAARAVCQVVDCDVIPTAAPNTYAPTIAYNATYFPTSYPPTKSPSSSTNSPAPSV